MAVEGCGWLAGSVGENSGSNSAKGLGQREYKSRWRCPVESGAVQNTKEIFAEGGGIERLT